VYNSEQRDGLISPVTTAEHSRKAGGRHMPYGMRKARRPIGDEDGERECAHACMAAVGSA
jgi:hypothetical protein